MASFLHPFLCHPSILLCLMCPSPLFRMLCNWRWTVGHFHISAPKVAQMFDPLPRRRTVPRAHGYLQGRPTSTSTGGKEILGVWAVLLRTFIHSGWTKYVFHKSFLVFFIATPLEYFLTLFLLLFWTTHIHILGLIIVLVIEYTELRYGKYGKVPWAVHHTPSRAPLGYASK